MTTKGERTFHTRNRRDQPMTTDMDEFIDGKPTGRIVTGYRVVDGELQVSYREPTPVKGQQPNPGALPERAVRETETGYIGVRRGLAAVVELEPVIVAPKNNRVVVQQHEDLTPVYVLEFDGPTGVERKDFTSARDAREYPTFLTSYYSTTLFRNFRLFREYRAPREEIPLEDL